MATSRAVEGKVLTDREVWCGYVLVGTSELAVRAMVVSQGAVFVKVVRNILALHFVATSFGTLNLLRDTCAFCVSLSISQITLPLASPLRVRALHLETSQSPLVKWSWVVVKSSRSMGHCSMSLIHFPQNKCPQLVCSGSETSSRQMGHFKSSKDCSGVSTKVYVTPL